MNRRVAFTLTMTTLFCSAISIARADGILKWRHVQHIASMHSQDVGDVDGHSFAVQQLPGIAFFPDGSTGTTLVVASLDYAKGSGRLAGDYTLSFNDGSALWFKFSGTVKAEGAKSMLQGTATVISGKGRYEGAKGEGTWEGTRIGPVAAGAISDIDNVFNIRK
jgi:hypothetical protein